MTSVVVAVLALWSSDFHALADRPKFEADPNAYTNRRIEYAYAHVGAAYQAAREFGTDPLLMLAIAQHESHFQHTKTNGTAAGVMQVKLRRKWDRIVATAEPLGGYRQGARVLRYWIKRAKGDVAIGLRGYACGNVGLRSHPKSDCAKFARLMLARAAKLKRAVDDAGAA